MREPQYMDNIETVCDIAKRFGVRINDFTPIKDTGRWRVSKLNIAPPGRTDQARTKG